MYTIGLCRAGDEAEAWGNEVAEVSRTTAEPSGLPANVSELSGVALL